MEMRTEIIEFLAVVGTAVRKGKRVTGQGAGAGLRRQMRPAERAQSIKFSAIKGHNPWAAGGVDSEDLGAIGRRHRTNGNDALLPLIRGCAAQSAWTMSPLCGGLG